MAEPWKEAVELLREYFDHKGFEWPGFSASHLQHRIQTRNGRWMNWSLIPETDSILSQACFDVDDLANNYVGAKIIMEDLTSLDCYSGTPVFGLAQPGTWTISICPRAKRYWPLYRATVMHEIGHLFLHSVVSARMLAYTPFASSHAIEERQANQFMTVGLLPRPVLWLAVARYAESSGINLREVLGCANNVRGHWQWKNRLLRPVIDCLALSRQLICLKLKQMRVFNQDTVNYHLSYQMETKWTQHEFDQPLRRPIQSLLQRWL